MWPKEQKVLSHGSGGYESEVKVLAGLVPSEGCAGECVPRLSPGSWWFAGNLEYSSA